MIPIEWISLIKIPLMIYAVNFMIAFVIIFLERKNPSSTLAWIMVLFMLPGVGIFLYFLLSQNIARQKIFKLSSYEANVLDSTLNDQIQSMTEGEYEFTNEEAEKWKDMILLHQTYSKAYYTQNNNIQLI